MESNGVRHRATHSVFDKTPRMSLLWYEFICVFSCVCSECAQQIQNNVSGMLVETDDKNIYGGALQKKGPRQDLPRRTKTLGTPKLSNLLQLR